MTCERMWKITGYLKVYFTDQEEHILRQIAQELHLSLSQTIKVQCKNLFHPSNETLPSLLDAKMCAEHTSDKYVKVYLSEKKYTQLKLVAKEKGIGMSRLIYKTLIAKPVPIEIQFTTDDIYEFIFIIRDTYQHLIGTAEGLWHRNIIYEHNKERLLSLGYEIRDLLQKYVNLAYRNRYAIRKTAIRHLDKKMDKIINDSLKNSGQGWT